MKKPTLSPLLSPSALALAACGGDVEAPSAAPIEQAVYTTFFPLESAARRIAAGAVPVVCLLPEDEDAEFWKPDRAALARYQDAALILANGGGFEKWLSHASLPLSRMCDTAAGLEEEFLEHAGTTHSHGLEGEHSHAGIDGHFWLDPVMAKHQARRAAEAMARAFPEHRDAFAGGLAGLERDLAELHRRHEVLAAELAGEPLLASHPAYDYPARRYGWQVTSFDLDPGEPLSAEQREALAAAAAAGPARLLLWESEPLPETASALSSEAGLESVVFDPGENPSAGERAAGTDFVAIQAANLDRLEAALGTDRRGK